MDTELYKASRDGNTQYLRYLHQRSVVEHRSSSIPSQITHKRNNIIHIASKFNHEPFISEAIRQCPVLVRQQNSKGDTPLHIASRFGHINVVKLLIGPRTIGQTNTQEYLSSSTGVSRSNPNGSNSVIPQSLSSTFGVSWSNPNESNLVAPGSLSSSAGVSGSNQNGSNPVNVGSLSLLVGVSGSNQNGSNPVTVGTLSLSVGVSGSNQNGPNPVTVGPLSLLVGVSGSHQNGSNPVLVGSMSLSAGVPGANLNGSNPEILSDIEEGLGEKPLWRLTNMETDTALHEALRNGREDVAEYLLDVDRELACSVNRVGESPLYLAAESRCEGAMRKILELEDLDFSLAGPHGQNPLHAAKYCSETIIKFLLEKKPNLMVQPDQHGKTALHYAIEAYLLKTTKLLLKIDPSPALLLDSEGFTPLLRASSIGWRKGFQAILEHCPESIEMCDRNGRNALHLLKMTRYTSGEKFLKIPELQELINERNNEGNTPLHLALMNRNHLMVRLLLETNGVDVRAINREGLSALDMSEQNWEESYKQRRMWYRLRKSKAPRGRYPNQSRVPFKGPPNSEDHTMTDYTKLANTLSVVAALLATVTFAAAFTIPGGYNSNIGKNLGVPLLVKKFALRVFVLADAFAMCSSLTVVFFLIWAMIGEHDLLRTLVLISHIVLKCSLYGTLIAFMSGLYAVVAPEALWVAILVCIMGTIVPFVVSQRAIIASATGVWRTWHIK